jgi:hypothetical protein
VALGGIQVGKNIRHMYQIGQKSQGAMKLQKGKNIRIKTTQKKCETKVTQL